MAEKKKRLPALTAEAQENQMISLATDLAEKKLRDGTASAQIIVHYLKLGSTREKLEKELLIKQAELAEAKIQSTKTAERIEELYEKAIDALRSYSGKDETEV